MDFPSPPTLILGLIALLLAVYAVYGFLVRGWSRDRLSEARREDPRNAQQPTHRAASDDLAVDTSDPRELALLFRKVAGRLEADVEAAKLDLQTLFERSQDVSFQLEQRFGMLAQVEAASVVYNELSLLTQLRPEFDDIPLHRVLAVRIYLSDPASKMGELEVGRELLRTVVQELELAEMGRPFERNGSWKAKLFGRTVEALTRPEVEERLRKLEKAAELAAIEIPQSEAVANYAKAYRDFAESGGEGILAAGPFLAVKQMGPNGKPRVSARVLSTDQLLFLEKNPHLYDRPGEILSELKTLDSGPIAEE